MEEILCTPHFLIMEPDAETGYTVCRYEEIKTGMAFVAAGYYLPTNKGLSCKLIGDWKTRRGFDTKTFVVDSFDVQMPQEEKSAIEYLKTLRCGIGAATARKLYQKFGPDIWNVIEREPERIKKVNGCGRVNTAVLAERYMETMAMRNLLQMFHASERSEIRAIMQLSRKLGADAVGKVTRNPYLICDYRFSFDQADQLAIRLQFDRNRPERISAAANAVLKKAESSGHTYLPIGQLVAYIKNIVQRNAPSLDVSEEKIRSTLRYMSDQGKLIIEDNAVYRWFRFEEEREIAVDLVRLSASNAKTSDKLPEYLELYEQREGIQLDKLQKQAVIDTFDSCVHIITGGPGTGKSTILKAILFCHEKIAEEVGFQPEPLLMAPTGRAARRMCETTGYEATTIHKALGVRAETEQESLLIAGNLEASMIILDETSMIDSHIASALFQAVPSGTQLVLVGDIDQLPSVGCGNVLREVINSGTISVTRLSTIYRQADGSSIVTNAKRIREGNTDLEWDRSFAFIEAPTPEHVLNAAVAMYCKCVERYSLQNVMLLNPFRNKGAISARELNVRIQQRLNPLKEGMLEMHSGGMCFRPGDLVMQTKNTNDVSNGDIGVIRQIAYRDKKVLTCVIEFQQNEGGLILSYEKRDMDNITLAYCCTIHKAQGSEFSTVLMLLHDTHSVMLRRNLIYTGITRAIDRVAIIGTKSAVQTAIQTDVVDRRNTRLATRLRKEKGISAQPSPTRSDPEYRAQMLYRYG